MRDLCRLSDVRTLVTELGFHPSRALGQNFMVDRNILDIFIAAAELDPKDRVLEVGPGLGVVTQEVLRRAAALTAIEKDHNLYNWLSKEFAGEERLTLIEGDALRVGIPAILKEGVDKFISNLPYTPGSRILLDVACDPNRPRLIAVTVQLEVAQRITAAPGSKSFGLMAVWCQLHYDCELVKVISPNCFWPRPAVKSAVVKLTLRPEPLLPAAQETLFYKLTRYLFQQRRKQLVAILAKAPQGLRLPAESCRNLLRQCGASESARPEEVTLEQWCALVRLLAGN